ncbi:bifunctional diguanylate cyclase/phosphodiesterase [Methylopila sp. M107]|uniref:bifunctional diguanylate cyclase/phosphodiesterase n=1 Tax=Methylopila sp. M107 TaxID=1101190 RepID=UPI0003778882|nr:bifunctional diguanylate cyclase/phosphodiesterase [Methylopila sp. M107]
MLSVIGCITERHDERMVALAAVICVLASYAALELVHQARAVRGRSRPAWLCLAGLAGGSGIWATHFIAMLAFSPELPTDYDVGLTALSLAVAVCLTGAGLLVASRGDGLAASLVGGLVVGVGVACMHYVGMAAYRAPGVLQWNAGLVAVAIAIGLLGAATALAIGLSRRRVWRVAAGALSLTLAICGLHFVSMTAVAIAPDPTAPGPEAQDHAWLAATVAFVSLSIIFLALAAIVLEGRERRRAERSRLVDTLANAAVEGILICQGDRIVTVNDSLAGLLRRDASSLIGGSLEELLPALRAQSSVAFRARDLELHAADGLEIPVEAIDHMIDVGGVPHRAVAIRDLRARRRAEAHIQFLAHHDPLTGLANRASFNERLDDAIADALATGGSLAVLCLDLDRFKQVNDANGHAAGDALLQRFAEIVGALLEEGETFARLGGDEFAIVVPRAERVEGVEALARRIIDAVLRSDLAVASPMGVSTSIGVAICPSDASDRESLLIGADAALYRAKRDGGGDAQLYEAAMGVAAREKRELEKDLRRAVERGEFHLVYQPQISIASRRIAGFETLIRWLHPERGEVFPATFIPIAEESDTISHIGDWVLEEACREAASWTTQLRIAVNVSAAQLHCRDFPQRVLDILLRSGLDATRLELEITETALVRDLDSAIAALRRLKSYGLRIAMDDFGTGYSSLSNLRAFPFDRIKIDRSFIRSVDDNDQSAAIVSGALALARALGLPVIAEGVETQAELDFLKREGCQEAQGYLIGRPERIERLEAIVRPTTPAATAAVKAARAKATASYAR